MTELSPTEEVNGLLYSLDTIRGESKFIYQYLKRLNGIDFIDVKSLMKKSDSYLRSEGARLQRLKNLYSKFGSEFDDLCEDYMKQLKKIHEEDSNDLELLNNSETRHDSVLHNEIYLNHEEERMKLKTEIYKKYNSSLNKIISEYINKVNTIEAEDETDYTSLRALVKSMQEEVIKKKEAMNKEEFTSSSKDPKFIYRDWSVSKKLNVDLINQYPGSFLYNEYHSDRRTKDGDIYINYDNKYEDLIVKYMKNDDDFCDDIENMNLEDRSKLLEALDWFELPVKNKFVSLLGCNEDNMMMNSWKNNKVVTVDGKNVPFINEELKKNHKLEEFFNSRMLKDIHYHKSTKTFSIDIQMKYADIIEDFLANNRKINTKLLKKFKYNGDSDDFLEELEMIGVTLKDKEVKEIKKCFFDSLIMAMSHIIDDEEYDKCLQKWLGNDYEWKCIYRASEHDYTAKTFHQYCDDIGPTLIIVKSHNGYIFGGYTTQSWNGNSEDKNDDDAFLFTLKNAHNIPPSQYKKREDISCAIYCDPSYGPVFCSVDLDLVISNNCDNKNSCWINNDEKSGYECDPKYKSSLFVNTNTPDDWNYFSVADYEVFCHE